MSTSPDPIGVLLIDDDHAFADAVAEVVRRAGYRATTAGSGPEGLEVLARPNHRIELVLLDIRMPGMDGLETLEQIVARHPSLPVVMLTGENAIDLVVRAIRTGATNYIYKGAPAGELLTALETVASKIRSKAVDGNGEFAAAGLVGRSAALLQLFADARMCARSEISVLITGETGVGKDLLARAIHRLSPRNARPFVAIDVPNIPSTMFESELFGHTRGAFTGATDPKQGLVQSADGGTVFLDEIGEFPIELQSKFLHVLDSQSVRRLGSVTADQVDVRVISATNRNLLDMVRERTFREDLFYRLRGIELRVPPLRERREDIALLAEHFADEFARRNAIEPRRLSEAAIALLERQRWPGNIRELRRTIEAAVVMSSGTSIEHTDIARVLDHSGATETDLTVVRDYGDVQQLVRQTKREELVRILERNNWNITKAASELDIDRSTLSKQMKTLGIDKPRPRY